MYTFGVPCLEDAIDKRPLVVTPNTSLIDVVNLMNQTRGNSCFLPDFDSEMGFSSMQGTRSSCILVIEVAREEARTICATKGDSSRECAAAWDIVEELLSVASDQRLVKENVV